MRREFTIESFSVNETNQFIAAIGDPSSEQPQRRYQMALTIRLDSAADATSLLQRLQDAGIKLEGAR